MHGSSSALSIMGMESHDEHYWNLQGSPLELLNWDDIIMDMEEDEDDDHFKGERLVHLLMAAAEALSEGNNSHDLARVILIRLNQLVTPSHPASTIHRLAAYFTQALLFLLLQGGPPSNPNHPPIHIAFHLLQHISPYLKFSHFTANQAILEASSSHRRLHIIDFDIMEGIQWPSFIHSLSSSHHLRITAFSRSGSRSSLATVQATGRRLTAFAASVGQPFSFHHCRLDPDETFRPAGLKMVQGEALVFNCMLHLPHLPHRPPESLASFLKGAKALNPILVTMVEEEEETGLGLHGGFVGRFMECFHHYSALFDSLEAGMPVESGARMLVERVYLGPRIASSVAGIYRDERGWSWLGELGYMGVPMSFSNQCQANLLLALFNHGFKAELLGCNKLVLSWRSRRLLSASLWTTPSSSPPPPMPPPHSLF